MVPVGDDLHATMLTHMSVLKLSKDDEKGVFDYDNDTVNDDNDDVDGVNDSSFYLTHGRASIRNTHTHT